MARMTFDRGWDFNRGNRPLDLNSLTQDREVLEILNALGGGSVGISPTEKGAAEGVAELDGEGRVPVSQLPDWLDEQALDEKYYRVLHVTAPTTAAIQDAVDEAALRWSTGEIPGMIISLDKPVHAGGPVTLPQTSVPLSFKGRGSDSTVVQKASSDGTLLVPTHGFYRAIGTVPAGPLRFDGFHIEGPTGQGATWKSNDNGIMIAGITNSNHSGVTNPFVHINDVEATGITSEAFYTSASHNIYTDNWIHDCSMNAMNPVTGSTIDLGSLIYVAGNRIDHLGDATGVGSGIETAGTTIIIVDNSFSDLYYAISARAHHTVVITGNSCRTWLGYEKATTMAAGNQGFAAINATRGNHNWDGPGDFIVADNIVTDFPRGIAAVVSDDTDEISSVLISGNVLRNLGREAIYLQDFEGVINDAVISDNLIIDAGQGTHNTYAAIRVGYSTSAGVGEINRPVVKGNVIAASTGVLPKYGVWICDDNSTTTVTGATIKDNIMRGAWATSPIKDDGNNTVSLNNVVGGSVPNELTFGSSHLWVDSTGKVRVKSSAPSSDTDGSIVGPAATGVDVYAVQTGGAMTLTPSDATNYQSIPGMTVSLDVGTYVLVGHVEYEGSTTADIRFTFLPGGGLVYSGSWTAGGLIDTAASSVANIRRAAIGWNSATSLLGCAGAAAPVSISPSGRIDVTTAGTLQLQAHQGVSEASNVFVRNGALKFTKIA